MRTQGYRHRGVNSGQLLHREHVGKRVSAAPAVLLGKWNAHQPQATELGDDLIRERLRAIELLAHRRRLADGEFAHGAADQLVVGAEVEVHRGILTESRRDASSATCGLKKTRRNRIET